MPAKTLGRALQVLGTALIILGILGYVSMQAFITTWVGPPTTPSPTYPTTPTPHQTATFTATHTPTQPTTTAITTTTQHQTTTTTSTPGAPLNTAYTIRSLYSDEVTQELLPLMKSEHLSAPYVGWLREALSEAGPSDYDYEEVLTTSVTSDGSWPGLSDAVFLGSARVSIVSNGSGGLIVTSAMSSGGAYFIIHAYVLNKDAWLDTLAKSVTIIGDSNIGDASTDRYLMLRSMLHDNITGVRTEYVLWRVFIEGKGSYLINTEDGEIIPVRGAYLLLEIPRYFYISNCCSMKRDEGSSTAEAMFWALIGYPAFSLATALLYPEGADELSIYEDAIQVAKAMISTAINRPWEDSYIQVSDSYSIWYSPAPTTINRFADWGCTAGTLAAATIANYALGLAIGVAANLTGYYSLAPGSGVGAFAVVPSSITGAMVAKGHPLFIDTDGDGLTDSAIPLIPCSIDLNFSTVWALTIYGPQRYLSTAPYENDYFRHELLINYSRMPKWAQMPWDETLRHSIVSVGYAPTSPYSSPSFYVIRKPLNPNYLASPSPDAVPPYALATWSVPAEVLEKYQETGWVVPEDLAYYGEVSNVSYIMPIDLWQHAVYQVLSTDLSTYFMSAPPGASAYGGPVDYVIGYGPSDNARRYLHTDPFPFIATEKEDVVVPGADVVRAEDIIVELSPQYEGVSTQYGVIKVFTTYSGCAKPYLTGYEEINVSVTPVPQMNETFYLTVIIKGGRPVAASLTPTPPRTVTLSAGEKTLRLILTYPSPQVRQPNTMVVHHVLTITLPPQTLTPGIGGAVSQGNNTAIIYSLITQPGNESITYVVKGYAIQGSYAELFIQAYGVPPSNYEANTTLLSAVQAPPGTEPIISSVTFGTGLTVFVATTVPLADGLHLVCEIPALKTTIEVMPS